MDKMKYLYVNGDSYADGLDDNNFGIRFKNRWSTILSKKLDLKEINQSESGGSNDRITRTTLEWFDNNRDKWDEVFVAIGWTFSFRKEIYDSVNDRWEQDQKTKDKEIEYIYNEKLYSLNMRNHILLLQYFFKSNNIKYHFHIAFGENPSNYTSDTLVDESHFLDISFMDFIRSLDNTFFDGRIIRWDGSEMSGFNRHPTENEHILWAKKLYNEIQI